MSVAHDLNQIPNHHANAAGRRNLAPIPHRKSGPEMMAVRAILLVAALAALTMTALWVAGAPVTCQEDMACWDCETMGNRICGGK